MALTATPDRSRVRITRTVADYAPSIFRPAPAQWPLSVHCGRCGSRCRAYSVKVRGQHKSERSRLVFACVLARCTRKGIVQHRTMSYSNITGY